jgi:hypothetical protein
MPLIQLQVKYSYLHSILNFLFFLIEKLNRDKYHSVNKIGHALHTLEPQFQKISFSDKIKVKINEINQFKNSFFIVTRP